jgi:hypothetical protein
MKTNNLNELRKKCHERGLKTLEINKKQDLENLNCLFSFGMETRNSLGKLKKSLEKFIEENPEKICDYKKITKMINYLDKKESEYKRWTDSLSGLIYAYTLSK